MGTWYDDGLVAPVGPHLHYSSNFRTSKSSVPSSSRTKHTGIGEDAVVAAVVLVVADCC